LPETGNWLVWDKRVEENQRDYNSDAELAWVQSKANSVRIFRHLWKGMIKDSEHGEGRVHPTQKPIALAEWCFNEYAPKSKTVMDLFGGSGSTLIACEKTGRQCFMMELSEKYCDVVVKRWEQFTGRKATLESSGES
jgi:DNA modification methylase